MSNKTAMHELIEFIEAKMQMHDFSMQPAYEKAMELLEKERQQIIDAVDTTYSTTKSVIEETYMPTPIDGSDYYNWKYGNK